MQRADGTGMGKEAKMLFAVPDTVLQDERKLGESRLGLVLSSQQNRETRGVAQNTRQRRTPESRATRA